MSGVEIRQAQNVYIPELEGLSDECQAEVIADHYAKISNSYELLKTEDFSIFIRENCVLPPPTVSVEAVEKKIRTMNKKAATLEGDLPIKIIAEFSEELAHPLSNIINEGLIQGVYPNLWKFETITPAPKVHPAEELSHLRKISGLLNFPKITDKILAEYLAEDMAETRDKSQYGNEKNLSIQHYLIKLVHNILCAVDQNSKKEAYAVILNMVDWSQAFDRQSHFWGLNPSSKMG